MRLALKAYRAASKRYHQLKEEMTELITPVASDQE